ncbi:MAG: hypothetical protein K1X83_06440 [Oligoflexia bacterium]|nr:hypothetical protein [Oligoflexia bacterium]
MPDLGHSSGSIDDGEQAEPQQLPRKKRLDGLDDQMIESLFTEAFTTGGGIRNRESPILLQQLRDISLHRMDRDDPDDFALVKLFEKHHPEIIGKVHASIRHSIRGRSAEIINGDPYVLDVSVLDSGYDQAVAWRFDVKEADGGSAVLVPDLEFLEETRPGPPLAPERFERGAAAVCVILYIPSGGPPSSTPYFFSAQYDHEGLKESIEHLRTAYASEAHVASAMRAYFSQVFEIESCSTLSKAERLISSPTVVYAREVDQHSEPGHHCVRLFGSLRKSNLRTGRATDPEIVMMDYDLSLDQGGFLHSQRKGEISRSALSRIIRRLEP